MAHIITSPYISNYHRHPDSQILLDTRHRSDVQNPRGLIRNGLLLEQSHHRLLSPVHRLSPLASPPPKLGALSPKPAKINPLSPAPTRLDSLSSPPIRSPLSPAPFPLTPTNTPISNEPFNKENNDKNNNNNNTRDSNGKVCKRRIEFKEHQVKRASVARRNERERNRVKLVNLGFATLRDHVPHGRNKRKMSKVDTLRSAAEYIRHLKKLLGDEAGNLKISTIDLRSPVSVTGSDSEYTSELMRDDDVDVEDYLDFSSWFKQ